MVAMAQFLVVLWMALTAMLVAGSVFGRRRPRRAHSRATRPSPLPPGR